MPNFLTIDDPKLPDPIEILSLSWKVEHEGTGYFREDKSRAGSIYAVKRIDYATSPRIQQLAISGDQLPGAILEMFKTNAVSSNQVSLGRYAFTNIFISSVQFGGQIEGQPVEGFTFLYDSARVEKGIIPSPNSTVQPQHLRLINRLKVMPGRLRQPKR